MRQQGRDAEVLKKTSERVSFLDRQSLFGCEFLDIASCLLAELDLVMAQRGRLTVRQQKLAHHVKVRVDSLDCMTS